MRAKTVNEEQNFERGQNPKKAMGIGGLDLKDKFEEMVEDLETDISMTKLTANEGWEEFLKKSLIGKKITSEMTKMPVISIKGGKPGKMSEKRITDEFTVVIQDVKSSNELQYALDKFSQYPSLIIADIENNLYELALKNKIYFDEG